MRRLIGRRGKGGGHGRTAGGWIDAAKLGPPERLRLQTAIAEKLAVELRKRPDKMARLQLRPEPAGTAEAAPPATTPGAPSPAAAEVPAAEGSAAGGSAAAAAGSAAPDSAAG